MYLGISLLQLRRYDEAEAELRRAATTGKNEVSMAHKYLGGLYWSKKEYKRAADELEKYLELSPKAPDAERVRGTVKELRGKS
jgi:tetratricopeptide (TPR) repeat protein